MNLQSLKDHPLLKHHNHKIPDSIVNDAPPMMAVIAKLTAKPGKSDELKEILAIACSLMRVNEPGVVEMHAMQSKEDPHIFKMFEVYRDEAALEEHRSGTPYWAEVLPKLLALLAEDPEDEWLHSILY